MDIVSKIIKVIIKVGYILCINSIKASGRTYLEIFDIRVSSLKTFIDITINHTITGM